MAPGIDPDDGFPRRQKPPAAIFDSRAPERLDAPVIVHTAGCACDLDHHVDDVPPRKRSGGNRFRQKWTQPAVVDPDPFAGPGEHQETAHPQGPRGGLRRVQIYGEMKCLSAQILHHADETGEACLARFPLPDWKDGNPVDAAVIPGERRRFSARKQVNLRPGVALPKGTHAFGSQHEVADACGHNNQYLFGRLSHGGAFPVRRAGHRNSSKKSARSIPAGQSHRVRQARRPPGPTETMAGYPGFRRQGYPSQHR